MGKIRSKSNKTKVHNQQHIAIVDAPTVSESDTKMNKSNKEATKRPLRRSPRRSTRNAAENRIPKEVVINRPTRKRKSTEKIEQFRQQEAEREQKVKEAKERSKRGKKKIQGKKRATAVKPTTTSRICSIAKPKAVQNDDGSSTSSLDEKDVICCICNCGVDFSEKEAFSKELSQVDDVLQKSGTNVSENGIDASNKNIEDEETTMKEVALTESKHPDEECLGTSSIVNSVGDDQNDDQDNDHDGDDDDQSSVPYCGVKLPSQLYDSNNALIICDTPGCDRSFHQRCHFVPVFCLPRGNWHCLICQFKEKLMKEKAAPKSKGRSKKKTSRNNNENHHEGNELIEALSKTLTIEEVDSIFPSARDKNAKAIDRDTNLYLEDNSVVTIQDRFEYQAAPLKASILNTEVQRRIKSTINGALGTIRLEEHTIRGYTETSRAKKSLLQNIERSKRVPQQLVQSVYRMGVSKMRIRELMKSIDSVIRNKNDRTILLDWFNKCKSAEHSISDKKDLDMDLLESKLFDGDARRQEPRFDIADYDGDIEDDDEDDTDPTKKIKCSVCFNGQVHVDNDVVMCDGKNCFRAFHMKCCNPIVTQQILDEDQHGTWFCPYCCALANAIHYTETEYYGDEIEKDESHGRARESSWDEADDVFPEAEIEVKSAELWKLGRRNNESDKFLSSLLGIQLTPKKENEQSESDDESDQNFSLDEEDDGTGSSSSDRSDENGEVDLQWDIEQNELDALSSCLSNESSDHENVPEDSNMKTRRQRKTQEEVETVDIGKVNTNNILHNKRNRTKVDYRR